MKHLLVLSLAVLSAGCMVKMIPVAPPSNDFEPVVQAQKPSIQRYKAELPKLNAQEAGEKWAELLLHRNDDANSPGTYAQPEKVMEVLPGPDSWPAIASTLEAKSKSSRQKLFGAVLVGDTAKQNQYIQELSKKSDEGYIDTEFLIRLAVWRKDVDLARRAIDLFVSDKEVVNSYEGQPRMSGGKKIERLSFSTVPDLVPIGSEAEELYLSILKRAKFGLNFDGKDGHAIAVQLCRKYGSTFPIHHSEVIDDVKDADLYLQFAKWFPKSKDGAKSRGRAYYVISQVMAGKGQGYLQDAGILSDYLTDYESIDYRAEERIKERFTQPEIAKASWSYLAQSLKKNPKLNLWEHFINASFAANKTAEMIPVLRTGLATKFTSQENAYNTRYRMADALVRAIGMKGTTEDVVKASLEAVRREAGGEDRLLMLGHVLNRPVLIERGLAQKGSSPYIAKDLIAEKRYAKAEKMLLSLKDDYERPLSTLYLAHLYCLQNRDKDLLKLLDNNSGWGVEDLKDIGQERGSWEETAAVQAMVDIGRVFLRNGKKELGIKALLTSAYRNPENDDTYEALLGALDLNTALKTFDDIFSHDKFEERPLIWKAIALQRNNRLDEAEQVVRQAILVDPSDGGTPHGKRMLAYKVLSEILAKKGNTKDSQLFKSVVAAIRLSEKADDYLAAGLTRQALDMYGQSLKIFTDAYCIQSRMAVNLAQQGRTAEAIQHFQRAFELMPSSFGRVETHCFGCEGVFTTGPAQGVAERVLTDAAQKDPSKPQNQYLLGYLRTEQDRPAEAATFFWNAVKLDPDYLNAWKKLWELNDSNATDATGRETILLNLLRLDPDGKHVQVSNSSGTIRDFAKAYNAFRDARLAVKDLGPLYELKATKKRLANPEVAESMSRFSYDREVRTPGQFVGKMDPLQTLIMNE